MEQDTHINSHPTALPDTFRPLFWSYRFADLDLDHDKKTIIVQLINYGTLAHWIWLTKQYGRKEIRRVLEAVQATEIKPRTRELAGLFFSITNWRYAPRGTH